MYYSTSNRELVINQITLKELAFVRRQVDQSKRYLNRLLNVFVVKIILLGLHPVPKTPS